MMTGLGFISWLPVQWVESPVEITLGPASIYNPEQLSALALLGVSEGLSACFASAPSSVVLTNLCTQDSQGIQEDGPATAD